MKSKLIAGAIAMAVAAVAALPSGAALAKDKPKAAMPLRPAK